MKKLIMGLTIHYNGRFNKDACLSEMIDEVKDYLDTLEWTYMVFRKQFPEGEPDIDLKDMHVYGIHFTPPRCETVSLCFLENRRMTSVARVLFSDENENGADDDMLYMLSTKTQQAGPGIHITIIKLFKHLIKKGYFEKLEVFDEGKYWETEDEEILINNFKKNAALIDSFALAIESTKQKKDESIEEYLARVADKLKNRNKNTTED